MPLTEKEIKIFEQSGDLWNSFLDLPIEHSDDLNDFRFHIHALQNIVLSRSAYREIHKTEKEFIPIECSLMSDGSFELGGIFREK